MMMAGKKLPVNNWRALWLEWLSNVEPLRRQVRSMHELLTEYLNEHRVNFKVVAVEIVPEGNAASMYQLTTSVPFVFAAQDTLRLFEYVADPICPDDPVAVREVDEPNLARLMLTESLFREVTGQG